MMIMKADAAYPGKFEWTMNVKEVLESTVPEGQGLTLVHISAQPEPLSVIEATASLHFPAQPEPFLCLKHTP